MKINSVVSKEKILEVFKLDKLDSLISKDETYWKSDRQIGWVVEIDDKLYGGYVLAVRNLSPEETKEHYQVLEQAAKETIEAIKCSYSLSI